MLLVQETHKKAYYLSHEESDESVGLSADVGIVVLPVPKTLELKTDGELVGLSANIGIVVLPVSKLIGAHLQACPYTKSSLRRGISELPERPMELSVSHFLIEGQQEVGDLKGQQEVGDLKEGLSDQYEEAITPHCAHQVQGYKDYSTRDISWLSNHMMVANHGVAKYPDMLKLQESNAKAG